MRITLVIDYWSLQMQVSVDSVGLLWGPNIFIPNKFPGEADATSLKDIVL